jgi:hypothetical protein
VSGGRCGIARARDRRWRRPSSSLLMRAVVPRRSVESITYTGCVLRNSIRALSVVLVILGLVVN